MKPANSRLVPALLGVILLNACVSAKDLATHTILDAELQQAHAERSIEVSKKRTPIEFDNGKFVDNCSNYLKNLSQASLTESVCGRPFTSASRLTPKVVWSGVIL